MGRRTILILLWLVGLAPAHVWGQTLSTHKALGRYQQLVWQDQHGLPQNGVSSILRTRDGYLWLGTIEGAARFDGVRFVVFDNNNTPEFKSNQILSLAEDRAGSLWLGAVSGGLTRYTDGRFRLYTKQDGLSSDFVRSSAGRQCWQRLDRHARRRAEPVPGRTLHGLHHRGRLAERSDSDPGGRSQRRALDWHEQGPGPVRARPLYGLYHAGWPAPRPGERRSGQTQREDSADDCGSEPEAVCAGSHETAASRMTGLSRP